MIFYLLHVLAPKPENVERARNGMGFQLIKLPSTGIRYEFELGIF
jgi:hypothetical protein